MSEEYERDHSNIIRTNICIIMNTKTGQYFAGWKRARVPKWLSAQNDQIITYKNRTDVDLLADCRVLESMPTYRNKVEIVELG